MRITELLDKKYDVSWNGGYNANFVTRNNRTGRIEFEYMDDDNPNNMTYIQFEIDGETGITKGGDALTIFGTVLSAIHEFLSKNPSKIITMTSEERSRTSLYRRLANRLGFVEVPWDSYLEQSQYEGKLPLMPNMDDDDGWLIFVTPDLKQQMFPVIDYSQLHLGLLPNS